MIVGCKKQDNTYRTSVEHPRWFGKAVMYEMNIADATPEGTFKAAEAVLDNLAELGIDAIRLNSIFPADSLGAVVKYKGVNPAYGEFEDFFSFVDYAHTKGIRVVIDWVSDCVSKESEIAKEHNDWIVADDGSSEVASLNYENTDVWADQSANMIFFEARKIDGIWGCGLNSVPADFWNETARIGREDRPQMIFVTDGEIPELQEKGSNAYLAISQIEQWEALSAGKFDADSLANFYVNFSKMPVGTLPVNFTAESLVEGCEDAQVAEKIMKQFAALSFVVPGVPLIAGGTRGMDTFYKDLINLRNKHASLWAYPLGGDMAVLPSDHRSEIFAFEREVEGDICLAMFNFSDKEVEFNIANHITTKDRKFLLPPHGFHIIFAVGDCFGDCDEIQE
ncbi:MAG: alpha-glucosidase C-terminal domain-containing protein [Bacteroidales bacterium]|nr:alpha-glucosidase C-terminal domain-containing protein [Bacteroidales bacterium]